MYCTINRKAEFSASHRYWLPELTETQNYEKFGLNARFPGHGHNYILYVSLLGEIDKYGMVQNLSDVKKWIKQQVTSQLNYSYLNDIWPEFQETLPTTENISRIIWQRLENYLPLVNIKLFEHSRLWADYRGNDMEASLTVKTHFSAAHQLALPELSQEENYEIYGKCARPNGHGHNYHLEVRVSGKIDSRTGMIVDLEALQNIINEYVIEPFDHTFLNKDVLYFAQVIPTAENIAVHIAQLLQEPIAKLGVELENIKLIESPNNSCDIDCRQLTQKDKQPIQTAVMAI